VSAAISLVENNVHESLGLDELLSHLQQRIKSFGNGVELVRRAQSGQILRIAVKICKKRTQTVEYKLELDGLGVAPSAESTEH
jgi:hypothetical protein